MILCDGNYIDLVHNWEPERSRVSTNHLVMYNALHSSVLTVSLTLC